LRLASGIKVYFACQPFDLRRGSDGLSAEGRGFPPPIRRPW
jgi:hypothetical protein